jgi:hypothetical protein
MEHARISSWKLWRGMMLFSFPIAVLFAATHVSAQVPTGADWSKWTPDRKNQFLEGFIVGSRWVASNAILPASIFPDEQIKTKAKEDWEQATKEFISATNDPKIEFPAKYNAGNVMLIMTYDAFKKNPTFERAIITNSTQALVSRLDELFKDRDNRKIQIADAVYLAKKMLEGLSTADAKVLLPYLRGEKRMPDGAMVPVYDARGKFVKAIEFP